MNHSGNFEKKIKFCYDIHPYLLRRLLRDSWITQPCFCYGPVNLLSGDAGERRMAIGRLMSYWRGHLIDWVVIRGMKAYEQVSQDSLFYP